MQRAAILIGVEKTGGLPRLQAVQQGVDAMRHWALSQPGMGDRVVVLTDTAGGHVTAADIRKKIREFVDLGTIEQLFVYFAGHGVNVRYDEFWLLSDAPDDPHEAVNVAGSVSLARHCGIPHVVLISDACRTAAGSIQAQAVVGSVIFPNSGPRDVAACVDVFYASAVGRPALEVKDANAATAGFQAVYTNVLTEGLNGSRQEVVQVEQQAGGAPVGRVRAWPLKRFLQAEVPTRLVKLGVGLTQSQTPDAIITSEPEAWLAEVTRTATRGGHGGQGGSGGGAGGIESLPREPETLLSISRSAVHAALQGPATATRGGRGAGPGQAGGLFGSMMARIARNALGHFETECGFRVRGTGVVEAVSAGASAEVLDGPGEFVRVSLSGGGPAASVLLVFEDGHGALLPAIAGFVAGLTYDEGELANVAYEPSDNTPRWNQMQGQLAELRELRAVIATAARLGAFRLEGKEDVSALIDRVRAAGGIDPTMAVYAAYALHELQKRETIEEIQQGLRDDMHLSLFDVALLAQKPKSTWEPMPRDVFPAVPLLSQGWALLDAYCVELPAGLKGIQRHVTDSLWTLFGQEGVRAVRAAINSQEVR